MPFDMAPNARVACLQFATASRENWRFLKRMLIGYNAVILSNYRTFYSLFIDIIFFSIRQIAAKL